MSDGVDILEETLSAFDGRRNRHAPLTTREVADALGCARRTAYNRLERLVERGDIETKKVGARGRVWWRSSTASDDNTASGSARDRDGDTPERARSRLDSVPGMIYRSRNQHDRSMTFVSDDCADLTGYGPYDLESDDVTYGTDVVHPDDEEYVRETIQSGLKRDGLFSLTYRIRTASGETRWAWTAATAFPTIPGRGTSSKVC